MAAAGWAAAIAVSVAADDRPCSVEDLTVCGPDVRFSASATFLLGSVVLLWHRPVLAAVCAVVFAAADLLWDPTFVSNVAWAAYAVLVIVLTALRYRAQREQRTTADSVAVDLRVEAAPVGHRPCSRTEGILVLAAGLALLGAAGSLVAWRGAESDQAEARARSIVIDGTVTALPPEDSEDSRLFVGLDRVVDGIGPAVRVDSIEEHAVGDRLAVRADPSDPGWTHLAAEPPDVTWWVTIAGLLTLGAAVCAARGVAGSLQRRKLSGSHLRGARVRWFLDEDGGVHFGPVDADEVVGAFAAHAPPADSEPQAFRRRTLTDGHLVGDLRRGGWVGVVAEGGRLLPKAPMVSGPGTPFEPGDLAAFDDAPRRAYHEGEADEDEDAAEEEWEGLVDAVPKAAAGVLPWSEPAPAGMRLAGRVGIVVLPLAYAGLSAWLDLGWDAAFAILLVGPVYGLALDAAFGRVVVDRSGIEICEGLGVHRVPWSSVTRIRHGDDDVVIVGVREQDDLELLADDSQGGVLAGAMAFARATAGPQESGRSAVHPPAAACVVMALAVVSLGIALGFY